MFHYLHTFSPGALQRRGRWKAESSLEHYLQEVRAPGYPPPHVPCTRHYLGPRILSRAMRRCSACCAPLLAASLVATTRPPPLSEEMR